MVRQATWAGKPCNYPHLSTPNQRLAGFVQIVPLCAELFEGPPRQATLSGSNIDRSRNYNGPCGWSEMWVIARQTEHVRLLTDQRTTEPQRSWLTRWFSRRAARGFPLAP